MALTRALGRLTGPKSISDSESVRLEGLPGQAGPSAGSGTGEKDSLVGGIKEGFAPVWLQW